MFFIYKITNKVNGKLYFGKSSDPRKRWINHLSLVRSGPSNRRYQYLHRAINKHGEENFLLEVIDSMDNEETAMEREKYFIAKYDTFHGEGYNLTKGGDGASGYKHTPEAIAKMCEQRAGMYQGTDNPFYGKTHSSETRKILSQVASERTGDKNAFYGKSHSDEARAKMSENYHSKQRYFSFEQAEQIRELYSTKQFTYQTLADRFATNRFMIKNIISFYRGYSEDQSVSLWPIKDNRINCGAFQERHFSFKMSEEIRKLYSTQETTYKTLANKFTTSNSMIRNIIKFYEGYARDKDTSAWVDII